MSVDARTSSLVGRDPTVLGTFAAAGVLGPSDLAVAHTIGTTTGDTTDEVLLAAALVVRALRLGHVCLDLADADSSLTTDVADGRSPTDPSPTDPIDDLPWPDPRMWRSTLAGSPAVAVVDPRHGVPDAATDDGRTRPLVFDGERVYLERYWRYERLVGDALLRDVVDPDGTEGHLIAGLDEDEVGAVLDHYFGTRAPGGDDLQRRGAEVALRRRVSVLAGGPGTGKTHTIARLLASGLHLGELRGESPSVALAAPTGKAAARLTEQLRAAVIDADVPASIESSLLATDATTIHRLLGYRDGIEFVHDASNPLHHDLVIIDETSMVALPLMARLIDALRPGAHLVLVGDPYQLVSVDAGSVLSDIVGPAVSGGRTNSGPLADNITVLERVHRFDDASAIAELAAAVRVGDPDATLEVLSNADPDELQWVRPDDEPARLELISTVDENARQVVLAAQAGDAVEALRRSASLKVLCGTRHGPLGSHAWTDRIERFLRDEIVETPSHRRWYVGRPITVTANDYLTGLFNGDVGVVVDGPDGPRVEMPDATGTRSMSTTQLDAAETWWAMTVHKSQGSEFDHAVVSLPDAYSRVLTNELLYTAITRGRTRVTILADEASIRRAVTRPVARASGLRPRLWPDGDTTR